MPLLISYRDGTIFCFIVAETVNGTICSCIYFIVWTASKELLMALVWPTKSDITFKRLPFRGSIYAAYNLMVHHQLDVKGWFLKEIKRVCMLTEVATLATSFPSPMSQKNQLHDAVENQEPWIRYFEFFNFNHFYVPFYIILMGGRKSNKAVIFRHQNHISIDNFLVILHLALSTLFSDCLWKPLQSKCVRA